jgi:hypothetical protein
MTSDCGLDPKAEESYFAGSRELLFPNGDDVIGRGVAPAKVIPSDWNAHVHILGQSLRFDMTLVRR